MVGAGASNTSRPLPILRTMSGAVYVEPTPEPPRQSQSLLTADPERSQTRYGRGRTGQQPCGPEAMGSSLRLPFQTLFDYYSHVAS